MRAQLMRSRWLRCREPVIRSGLITSAHGLAKPPSPPMRRAPALRAQTITTRVASRLWTEPNPSASTAVTASRIGGVRLLSSSTEPVAAAVADATDAVTDADAAAAYSAAQYGGPAATADDDSATTETAAGQTSGGFNIKLDPRGHKGLLLGKYGNMLAYLNRKAKPAKIRIERNAPMIKVGLSMTCCIRIGRLHHSACPPSC